MTHDVLKLHCMTQRKSTLPKVRCGTCTMLFVNNFYCLLFFLVIQSHKAGSTSGIYSLTNISLKCEESNQECSPLFIGESVDLLFKANHSFNRNKLKENSFHCCWLFKPIHDGNYVELHVRDAQTRDCKISNLGVYVSDVFTDNVCNSKSIKGLKFIGKDISLNYNCLNSLDCSYKLEMTLRETSPVNTGCDFKMSEMGYRYYLMYELNDAGFPSLGQATTGSPVPGMAINHVRYSLAFVNRENLGVTTCFQDQLILPKEDIPSCHSSTDANCEWDIVQGVQRVNEIYDLKGSQWKIYHSGIFQTKSRNLQIDALCMYIEYLLDKPGNNALVYIYGILSAGKVLITNYVLTSDVWHVARIIAEVPNYLREQNIQLVLEITLNGYIYINKIYGCNPFTMEDHILISAGNNIILYGSIVKEALGCEVHCKNGGKWINNRCICPVGFRGNYCEIGCGENRFGDDCGSQCSLFNKGCKRVIICDDFHGCTCAPGFKGLYCQSACDDFEYGVNCEQRCGNCFELKTCDKYTGECLSGCKKGYKPPECIMKLLHFIKPPASLKVSFREVTIDAVVDNDTIAGFGEPSQYEIQLMVPETENAEWQHFLQKPIPPDYHIKETVRNLQPSTTYKLRIILWAKPNQQGFEGDEVPSITFYTPCRDNIKYKMKVFDVKIYEASVSWEKEMEDNSDCKVEQFQLTVTSGWSSVSFLVNTTQYTFTELLPGTIYRVRMKPQLKSDLPYTSVSFITHAKCSGEVLNLKTLFVGSTSVGLKWEPNSSKNYKFKLKYECQRILADEGRNCSNDANEFSISTSKFNITNLFPFREYLVSVGEDCESASKSSVIQFITNIGVPYSKPEGGRPVILYPNNVTFEWSPPNDCTKCNGYITGYHIELIDTNFTILHTGFEKRHDINVEGLSGNKTYFLRVFYNNDAGWNSTAYMEIPFTTPLSKEDN